MTYIIAVWVPPHRERSVVPTRNFTPRLSSLSTYLSRTIEGSGTCTKYASVVCTNIWIFMKDASTISRRYSTIAVDRCQWPTRVVPMRSIAITIQACGKCCVGRVPLRLSFPLPLLFFYFSFEQCFSIYIRCLHRARSTHRDCFYLFNWVSFLALSLVYSFSTFYSLSLMLFSEFSNTPFLVFSAFIWPRRIPFPLSASDIPENFPLDTKSSESALFERNNRLFPRLSGSNVSFA